MHTGSQPVLAECFTPPFEVMSAKKFPGMLDPTPMSQAFAKQGLRIPTVSQTMLDGQVSLNHRSHFT